MDRSPYYAHPRGSASSASASREEHDPRHGADRLPPILPSSQSIPKLPLARPDALGTPGHRIAPIKDADSSPYAAHRPYPPMSDRSAPFDPLRHHSPPSSIPVGLVSSDYMHPRPSLGDNRGPVPSNALGSSSSYPPQHLHRPDPYLHDPLRAHASSHVPHHIHYDLPPSHVRTLSQSEAASANTPIKRPRVSLACLACRNRKSRCDGNRPTCKTCATMKIACKWPEVDFRRAKTGEAARTRKRSPPGPSSQRSPESVAQPNRDETDPPAPFYARLASERNSLSMLPSSQSMPLGSHAPGVFPPVDSSASSPTLSRGHRYRTHSDGDREARHAEPAASAVRSPTERPLYPSHFPENRSTMYGQAESHTHAHSSAGMVDARQESGTARMRDERAQPYLQDRRTMWEQQLNRPLRALPESRFSRPSAVALRCINRAAEIAILARPGTDAHRVAVKAHMRKEASLEDLADETAAGERLDQAFAADWDAIGSLFPSTRRPFMDVAAGLVGVLEITASTAQYGETVPSTDAASRLHLFRLRTTSDPIPDLRHINIAIDLPARQERELLETISIAGYDTLSYPIPVDRLSVPLTDSVQRALEHQALEADNGRKTNSNASSTTLQPHAAPSNASDDIPFVRKQDVKPPQPVLELFFQAYVRAVGDQMPGLDTKVIGSRIRDGSISALLANALCAIGASLHERRGQRPAVDQALSSQVYLERARALIGAALRNPDLEAILALGVMAIRDILMGEIVSSAVLVSSAARLCMQLDLHRAQPSRRSPSPSSAEASDNPSTDLVGGDVFWMVYCLDRITSIATARPLAIKDADIDTVFPAIMRNGEPCIFAALVRQLHYLGRLVEVVLSSRLGAPSAPGDATERFRARQREIDAIGADLVGHYESLPSALQLGPANLGRTHEKGEALSFLQLHLTHNMALLHRSLLPGAGMTNADFDAMRSAAAEIVEICKLGEALDPTLLADTPLSAVACFLAGCVSLSEIEMLDESMQAATSSRAATSRNISAQLEAAQSMLDQITTTLSRHAEFWPVARRTVNVLQAQRAQLGKTAISPATIASLVSQVEAIHVVVRRPEPPVAGVDRQREADRPAPVQIRKVHDLEVVRSVFPHLC